MADGMSVTPRLADIGGLSSRANPNALNEYRPYLMVLPFRGRGTLGTRPTVHHKVIYRSLCRTVMWRRPVQAR